MSVFRSYFTKDNTLIYNKYVNTGLNPVAQIFYGTLETTMSRYIFSFDTTELANRIGDFRIPNNGTIQHTLKLTNTLLYDKQLLGNNCASFNQQASSFDLVLFRVPQYWDEGTGYDFEYNNTVIDINAKIYETASNWFQCTGSTLWNEPGIYSGVSSSNYQPLTTIHFDLGDEDISVDLTSLINSFVQTGQTGFYGLGLAFTNNFETLITQKLNSVGFFGKDTNTYFEPFIETTWTENIKDDRNEFYYNKDNKLYLYTNIKKDPVNLDSIPSAVTISDYNGDIVQTITTGITQESLGVYSVTINIDSSTYNNLVLVNFSDTWQGLKLSGKTLNDVSMEFTIREENYFNIGNEVYEPEDYGFSFSGIKFGQKIPRGEIRKIIIGVRKMYEYDNVVIDGLSYRLYVKQGINQIDIIPYGEVARTANQNYFYLDTSWMIAQDYFLELKLDANGTSITKDAIEFSVLDKYSGSINFRI